MELEYYLVSELASKLGVTEKEIIHRGIRNELPIYVSRDKLNELNDSYISIEKTIIEFYGDDDFETFPAGSVDPKPFEQLSSRTLGGLDIANIYDWGSKVKTNLNLFSNDKNISLDFEIISQKSYSRSIAINLDCLIIFNKDITIKQPNHYAYISKLPDSIQIAIDVYEKFWADLPENMRKPPKAELEDYIKSKIDNPDKTMIEAIIKISTPDDMRLGGKPERNRTENWKLKKDR